MGDAALVLLVVVSRLVLLVWAQPPSMLALLRPLQCPQPCLTFGDLHLQMPHSGMYSSSTSPHHGWPFLIFQVLTQIRPSREPSLVPSRSGRAAIHTNRPSPFQHPVSSSPHHWPYLLWSCTSSSLPPLFKSPKDGGPVWCVPCCIPCIEIGPSVWHQTNAVPIFVERILSNVPW